jgi:hypothetical protein
MSKLISLPVHFGGRWLRFFFAALLFCFLSFPQAFAGRLIEANPDTYRSLVSTLQPGDTLSLAAGTYTSGLPISNLHGASDSPIIITGPESGGVALFEGSRSQAWNTIQLENTSYLILRNMKLDGLDIPFIDAVNARGINHHITVEGLEIVRHGGDQLTVGITSHGPAWDWVIRNNKIIGAGTGMYLGNWQGNNEPFVGGLIEHNLIQDTIGYNIQIKQMNSRSYDNGDPIPGMPTEDRKTIIRHNVFSKAIQPSTPTEGPRPNLLVGYFPLTGPGSNDLYEIYGNFFYENTTEALFQGEGNVALYDNVFYTSSGSAINIRPHNDVPRSIQVFHNTVLASGSGIRVTGVNAGFSQLVKANAVFAGTPITTDAGVSVQDNVTAGFAAAGSYLNNPTGDIDLLQLDLYPKVGTLAGSAVDTTAIQSNDEWDVDFNGDARDGTYRGAYAGEGQNPGWTLALDFKPEGVIQVTAPTISSQPSSQTVEVGQSVSFNVVALGSGPLSYQWRRDGTPISGATAASYTLPLVSADDNGAVFDCVVANAQGSVVSDPAMLTVVSDTEAPSLVDVKTSSATNVVVRFSEAVSQATAEALANYDINGGVQIIAADLLSDTLTVRLEVSELMPGATYTLTVNGIQDRAPIPNTIAPFSSLTFTYSETDDFEGGSADNWTPLTPGRWEVVLDEGDNAYHLNTTNYDAQSGDRLGEYTLLPGSFGDFDMTLQAKLGDDIASNAQADYAIVFGYQDENNYYYMMFNNDMAYSQLFKIENGTRSMVAATTSDWVNDNAYHAIGIHRENGEITVTYDGIVVVNVVDGTFGAGQVGVGSLNDSAYFDDISVKDLNTGTGGGSGNKAPTEASAVIETMEALPNVPVTPTVLDPNPGDTHTFSIVTQPINGTAWVVNNMLVYQPDIGFVGADSFTFKAEDSGGLSVIGTASVTVSPIDSVVDDNPVGTGAFGPLLGLTLLSMAWKRRRRVVRQ